MGEKYHQLSKVIGKNYRKLRLRQIERTEMSHAQQEVREHERAISNHTQKSTKLKKEANTVLTLQPALKGTLP